MNKTLNEAIIHIRHVYRWHENDADQAEAIIRSAGRPISTRLVNCLLNQGYRSIFDIDKTANDLMEIYNFGKKSLKELRSILAAHNRKLRDDPHQVSYDDFVPLG